MNRWFLILASIVLLAVVFAAARIVSDRQNNADSIAGHSGETMAPEDDSQAATFGSQHTYREREPALLEEAVGTRDSGNNPATVGIQHSVTEYVQEQETGQPGMFPSAPGSDTVAPATDASGGFTYGIPPEGLNPQTGPGIPPEGLLPGNSASNSNVVGPGMTINTDSLDDPGSGGVLNGPGDVVPILGAPDPGLPGDAPEATGPGIPGLPPEASDPGVSGPAPEDS